VSERFLLDTHTLIWALSEPKRLSRKARGIITSSSDLCVSAASTWEMAIKVSNGKLTLPVELSLFIGDAVADLGVSFLPIEVNHTLRVQALPWHHRDPFDRLIAAQCVAEALTVLSADRIFADYGVRSIW
jgi:PIN domain nuclease of toxin-antitoxin system